MSNVTAWLLLFTGFFASAASQIIIKARVDPITSSGGSYRQLLADPLIWLAAACIVVFVFCWYAALTRLQLSVMMAWSAVVLPIVALGGWVWLGEPLGAGKLAAIAVIAAGVALLSLT